MNRDDIIDALEGFLTVFVVGFTAAVMSGTSYVAPNKWAIMVCVLGGLLAAVRKIQAHRAPAPVVKILLLGALMLGLTGCAGLSSIPFDKMSAEAIKEVAKIKDAGITCVSLGTPWGRQSAIFINVDRGVITSGAVTVDPDCKASVTNIPAPKP